MYFLIWIGDYFDEIDHTQHMFMFMFIYDAIWVHMVSLLADRTKRVKTSPDKITCTFSNKDYLLREIKIV